MSAPAEPSGVTVCIVGAGDSPPTFLVRLFNGLARAGVEIAVASPHRSNKSYSKHSNLRLIYAPAWHGNILFRLIRLGILIIRALFRSPRDLVFFLLAAKNEAGLFNRLRLLNRCLPFAGLKANILYFPWTLSVKDYYSLTEFGIPIVVSCRGEQVNVAPHDPKRKGIIEGLNFAFARAAKVHCVSDRMLLETQSLGLDPKKSAVIRPAIDHDRFTNNRNPVSENCIRLVSVGSLIWRKGYEYMLCSLAIAAKSGFAFELDIIGDGPERQRILYTIHDLGLNDRVRLLGKLDSKEIIPLLQNADLFLFASHSEGIPNAVLEAMACGLPVATTDCGGVREAVRHGIDGFVVPVGDTKGLAEAVIKLAKDPELRARMGSAARERVVQEFSLDRQVNQFIEMFRQVASGKADA